MAEQAAPPSVGLNFGGGDQQQIRLESAQALELAGGDFTVEAWIRPQGLRTDADMPILGAEQPAQAGGLQLLLRGGRLYAALRENTITGSTPLQADCWHHVALRSSTAGARWTLLVNGIVDAEAPGAALSEGGQLVVGRGANDNGGYDFFQGVMAEVRLWREARSDEQIQAFLYRRLSGQERSLAGYWPLDEGTGLAAHDRRTPIDESSGQPLPTTPHDGTIARERWVPAEDLPLRALAPGIEAAAVVVADLSGGPSGLEVPNVPALAIANSLTVEAWVQVPNLEQGGGQGGEPLPVVSMFSGSKGWELRWGGGQCTFVAVINNTTYEIASGSLAAGAWLHAAATYDGRQLALYVNGVRKGIRSASGAITVYPGALGIGCSTYRANAGLRGRLAEVRVWNRACTQAEIQQWLFRRRTGSESGLAGLWPLEGDGTAANSELNAQARRGVAWVGAGVPLPDSPERARVRPPRRRPTGTGQGPAQPPGGTEQGTAGEQDKLQQQIADLAREISRLEAANQALRQDRAKQASELEAARRELEKEKNQGPGGTGEVTSGGTDSATGGGTQLTSLQDFVQNANDSIKRAREELRRQGGSYSLERVSLEVKMIPARAARACTSRGWRISPARRRRV